MKNLVIFFIFIITTNLTIAQHSVELGNIFKGEKFQTPISIIDKNENGYYVAYSEGFFTSKKYRFFIKKFGLDLTAYDEEIIVNKKGYNGEFHSMYMKPIKGNLIHIFYLITDSNIEFYRQNIDLKTSTIDENKLITSIKHISKSDARESNKRFYFDEDNNNITLLYTSLNKKKTPTEVIVQNFDLNFTKKTTKTYQLPFNNNIMYPNSFFTNKKGEVFLLYKKYDNGNITLNDDKHNYEYLLYKIHQEKIELLTKIRPDDVHLRKLNPSLTDNGELVLTGLFSKSNKYAMRGIYTSKIDLNTGSIIYSKYNTFSSDFLTKSILNNKKKDAAIKKYNNGKLEDPNYILRENIKIDNDELLILAEKVQLSKGYYYHGDIAVIKLNNQGDIVWSNKIRKNQYTQNPLFSSYFSLLKDNKLLCFYNGSSRNINQNFEVLRTYFNDNEKRALISASIDLKTGNTKKEVLINTPDLNEISIQPKLHWEIDNEILMFGTTTNLNKKGQRLVKFKL